MTELLQAKYRNNVFSASLLFDAVDIHCFDKNKIYYDKKICPICGNSLPKTPAQQCKCKLCGNKIFVRKSIFDNKNILLDERSKAVWSEYKNIRIYRNFIYNMLFLLPLTDIDLLQLHQETGKTYEELLLAAFLLEADENAEKTLLGLMRNDYLNVAYITERFYDIESALKWYLAIMYLDISGYSNEGYTINGVLYPAPYSENYEFSCIAPVILDKVITIMQKQNYTLQMMYECFVMGVKCLPVIHSKKSVDYAWKVIRKELLKAR